MTNGGAAAQVAAALGRDQVVLTRVQAGASRAAYTVSAEPAGRPLAFLLVEERGGGLSLDLVREAGLLQRLWSQGVAVPEVLGVLADPPALLMELVPGHAQLEPSEADALGADYMTRLAALHRLEPRSVLPDCPLTTHDAVAADLTWWRDLAATSGAVHVPLVRLAGELLAERRPAVDEPSTLLHGDAGAGNFLVHEGAITALLDWEMCHAGDRHEDLGWIHARMVFTPFGSLKERYAEYEVAAGLQLDPRRLLWAQAYASWKCVVAVEARLRAPALDTPALVSQYVTLAYQPVLASLLLQLLEGSSLPEPEPVAEATTGEVKVLDELLTEDLSDGARAGVRHLRALAAREQGLAQAWLRDLAGAGLTAAEVADPDPTQLVPVLHALGRDALRRAATSGRVQRLLDRARENGLLS